MLKLKKMLAAVLVICCGALSAEEFLDVISRAEEYINRQYKSGSYAHQYALKKLSNILGQEITEEEKVTLIKKEFAKAFQKTEKPLIFTPPVSWHIHSLALGFDIQESASQTSRTVDIFKNLSTSKNSQESTTRKAVSSTHKISAGATAGGEISLNPFAWLKDLSKTKISLSGSYAYGRDSVNQASELWSKSQQEVFSRESSRITEMIQQTNIKNFHLTFTVTVSNNGSETLYCDLSDAYIPVYGERAYNINAKPFNMEAKVLEIPPRRNKDIVFRMELDNTNARALAAFMANNSPQIDILKGGQLRIRTKSGKDAISESTQVVATIPVKINLPEFAGNWNIRVNHTSNGKLTTLREALNAIAQDFDVAVAKTDIFQYNDGDLDEISKIPFGKFGENDKECRYIAFLQAGNNVYERVDSSLLNAKLPADGCTIWVIDLENLENYKNTHPKLQQAIYKKIKEAASDGFLGLEKGNAAAQFRLAKIYDTGWYVKKDAKAAFKWYKKSAEQEYAKAQNNLGVCYENGYGVEKNLAEAVKWYRKAAEQGDATAQNNLGVCYYNGAGVPKDYPLAVEWYRKAAAQGYAQAQHNLGLCYYRGEGILKDLPQAVYWYRSAANQGHAAAQCKLGACYYRGEGIPKDYTLAVEWYRKAAEQGHAEAQNELGWCYYCGNGVDKNLFEAVNWYRKAADQGYLQAQHNLGWCYYNGIGVPKDYSQAVFWYRKSADQGHALAQANLGCCYYNGYGVPKDYSLAVEWYRKSAEQGNASAQNKLGLCYEFGVGVPKDYSLAVEWYRESAGQGNASAQNNLGVCYYWGIGVSKDNSQAVSWYRKSADQGHDLAKRNYNILVGEKVYGYMDPLGKIGIDIMYGKAIDKLIVAEQERLKDLEKE